jgi:hypothetical protein
MGEAINRRDFLRQTGVGAIAATLSSASAISASNNTSARNFDSMDSRAGEILEELLTLERKDIPYRRGRPDCDDDTSFLICTNTPNYHMDYFVKTDGSEELIVGGDLKFCGKKTPTGVELASFGYINGKQFGPKAGVSAFLRIRELLGIEIHSQNCKGKDLTSLVNDLLAKVSFVELEVKSSFPLDNIKASFEKRNFKVEYEFDGRKKAVDFTIIDEKKKLNFWALYNENGDIDTMNLGVYSSKFNQSNFELFLGKLRRFPIKVYNEPSAMGIVAMAKGIEMYLTSTIKNKKLENYTDLFERLTSLEIDNKSAIDKSNGEIKIKTGEVNILYAPGTYDHFHLNLGKDKTYICTHRETKEVKSVIINGHPFSLIDDRVGFIRNTYSPYTQEQANFIIKRAQEFYNNKIRPLSPSPHK